MKKTLCALLAAGLTLTAFAGCSSNTASSSAPAASSEAVSSAAESTAPAGELKKITVGASPTPHAEILAAVKEELKAQGYDLVVTEFVDYVQPNVALEDGTLDANYFQHKPYMDSFNQEQGTHLVSLAAIHYEPFGIYPGKTKTLEELADGAQIAVPNDTTNEARALLLLEAQGIIKVREGAGLTATAKDIVENPKNVKIVEMEAAQLARSLQDVNLAVINGNYAIQAGLKVGTDAIATEGKDSEAAQTYANVLSVREGDENREDLKALAAALQSETVKQFIADKYEGAVVAMF